MRAELNSSTRRPTRSLPNQVLSRHYGRACFTSQGGRRPLQAQGLWIEQDAVLIWIKFETNILQVSPVKLFRARLGFGFWLGFWKALGLWLGLGLRLVARCVTVSRIQYKCFSQLDRWDAPLSCEGLTSWVKVETSPNHVLSRRRCGRALLQAKGLWLE